MGRVKGVACHNAEDVAPISWSYNRPFPAGIGSSSDAGHDLTDG